MRRIVVTTFACLLVAAIVTLDPASGAPHARIPLPRPAHNIGPLAGIGLRPDRLLASIVPGSARNTEAVTAAIGPTGAPTKVTELQRLHLTGTGNYIVRETGPARDVETRGNTVPPIDELGTVVWQGFSPGSRSLAALLTLDAGIEARRLPMAVSVVFQDAIGRPLTLSRDLTASSPGIATVTLTNQTALLATEVAGTADLAPLATSLRRLYDAAGRTPRGYPPPVAGDGLPTSVAGTFEGDQQAYEVAPIVVAGTVGATGPSASISGLGVTPKSAITASVHGRLWGSTTIRITLRAGQRLLINLRAQPWLDQRALLPPMGFATWQAWAASHPSTAERRAASQTLMTAAASAARAADYTPYLEASLPGTTRTTFRYVSASVPQRTASRSPLHARPLNIAMTVLAALAILGCAAALRRQL